MEAGGPSRVSSQGCSRAAGPVPTSDSCALKVNSTVETQIPPRKASWVLDRRDTMAERLGARKRRRRQGEDVLVSLDVPRASGPWPHPDTLL